MAGDKDDGRIRRLSGLNPGVSTLIEKIETVRDELSEEAELLKQDENFYKLLNIPEVDMNERMEWLRHIFDGRVSEETMALLCILSERIGMYEFYSDIQEYVKLLEAEREKKKGIIYSVTPLDEKTMEKFTKQLKQFFKSDVVLVNRIDPGIIGGVLISVDGKLIDMSLRKKMQDLHLSIDEALRNEGDE